MQLHSAQRPKFKPFIALAPFPDKRMSRKGRSAPGAQFRRSNQACSVKAASAQGSVPTAPIGDPRRATMLLQTTSARDREAVGEATGLSQLTDGERL